jgi:hypothetical protein
MEQARFGYRKLGADGKLGMKEESQELLEKARDEWSSFRDL